MAGVVALVLLIAASATAVDREVLCAQKAETGLCKAYIPSYFYNSESGECEFFVYGGCGGNDNRFESKESCHATCGVQEKLAIQDRELLCTQKAETGLCDAYFPSYYYNHESGECESFVYGGCGGNSNRFRTKDECHATCAGVAQKSPVNKEVLCAQEAETGFCRAYIPSYFYNTESGECESFIYGGCGGNDNRFDTKEECHATCGAVTVQKKRSVNTEILCAQKSETGLCRAYIPSYFYNTESGECEFFVYGGCGGNDNRFNSKEECHATCGAVTVQEKRSVDTEVLCAQEAVTGPCRAYFPSYFYNTKSGECEFFVYGGCGGNDNRFNSKETCHATCGAAPVQKKRSLPKEVLCSQVPVTGLCLAYFPSFFYNPGTGKCESFVYGGCGGNENRFATEAECHATCAGVGFPHEDVHDIKHCFLEPKAGPCKNNQQRFFFNRNKGQCEPFVYGGCDGNQNNWASEKDCYDHCLM